MITQMIEKLRSQERERREYSNITKVGTVEITKGNLEKASQKKKQRKKKYKLVLLQAEFLAGT